MRKHHPEPSPSMKTGETFDVPSSSFLVGSIVRENNLKRVFYASNDRAQVYVITVWLDGSGWCMTPAGSEARRCEL